LRERERERGREREREREREGERESVSFRFGRLEMTHLACVQVKVVLGTVLSER